MQLSFDFRRRRVDRRKSARIDINGDDGAVSNCDLTTKARILAQKVGARRTSDRVSVSWNPRLQTTAGTAEYVTSRIDLNPKLRSIGPEAIDRILRHELAHLVANERAAGRRIQPHGIEWKKACADLGIPGEKASHSLPLRTRKRLPNYAYRCPNCEEVVFRVRRMARYSACYACCKAYNSGEYHPDFAFERIPVKLALASEPS